MAMAFTTQGYCYRQIAMHAPNATSPQCHMPARSRTTDPDILPAAYPVPHLWVHPQGAPRVQEQHTWQRLGHGADAGPLPQRPRRPRPCSRRPVAPWSHSSQHG